MPFQLPFAPHIGFPAIDAPLFKFRGGSSDPVEQIAFVAAQGFAGMQDPFAAARPEPEQSRIGAAIRHYGLRIGCFAYAVPHKMMTHPWGSGDPQIEARIQTELERAFAIGCRTGARQIAVLSATWDALSLERQHANMAALLRRLAPSAAESGFTLCLEAVDPARLPWALLHHLADAAAIVRAADHSAVRLIFDTAHVAAMDGDPVAALGPVWALVEIVQLADHPGRLEIGAGTLPIDAFLQELIIRDYRGLVELEHRWSAEGASIEADYIDRLAALDRRLNRESARFDKSNG